MSRKQRINPIAKEVQDVFDGVYAQTQNFVNHPLAAINGLIVSGDAGVGKTYTVKKALHDLGVGAHAEYIKGGKITAASLYVKLYNNRAKHRVVVLDDCDIIHHAEKRQIIPMLLGACDLGQNRDVSWETAKPNPLMVASGASGTFKFEGTVIWITNDTIEDIGKALKQWNRAIFSRFNVAKCYFTDEQKFMYTMHLCDNKDMLGANCFDYAGGYPQDIIEDATEYMSAHYRNLIEVTPRIAIRIADIMNTHAANASSSNASVLNNQLTQLWS